MDAVFSQLVDIKSSKGGGDSYEDRLSCKYTVFLLSTFGIVLMARYYVSAPINCWCPAHFHDSHVDFTNNVCWTTDTYYLPIEAPHIPKEDEEHAMIGYYQWVPLILACQAILFYLPRPIWCLLNKRSGVAVSTITDAAIECQQTLKPEDRVPIISYMSNHMGRYLMSSMTSRTEAGRCAKVGWWLYGRYLVVIYLLIKLVYLANAIGQLYLLNLFLGFDNYHQYGIEVMKNLFTGNDWRTSDRFPRVTLCDVKVRLLGNVHRYTIQCSLPMNLFNEIIFIFVWFWIAFVSAITVYSFLRWCWICFLHSRQVKYMYSRILTMDSYTLDTENIKRKEVDDFVTQFLRADGCLIVRLVSENTSDIIAAEFIYKLWQYYNDNNENIDRVYRKAKLEHGHTVEDIPETVGKTDKQASTNNLKMDPEKMPLVGGASGDSTPRLRQSPSSTSP